MGQNDAVPGLRLPLEETGGAGASSTSTGAGSAVVNVTAPTTPGTYKIVCTYAVTGTAETALANLRLKWNNVIKISGLPTLTSSGFYTVCVERADLDGVNNIRLEAVAAATTGAIYTGSITYTRIG